MVSGAGVCLSEAGADMMMRCRHAAAASLSLQLIQLTNKSQTMQFDQLILSWWDLSWSLRSVSACVWSREERCDQCSPVLTSGGVRPGYYESVGGTISGLSISGFILVSTTDQLSLTESLLRGWMSCTLGWGQSQAVLRVQYWSLPHMYSTKYKLFENDADDEILKYSHYLSSVHCSLVHHLQAPLIKQCWKVKIAALVVTLSKK